MVDVRSEIGRLRRALVHEPGLEVDRMVPAMMEQLLFDDILYGDRARDEHARFRRVLQHFDIDVIDAADLLAETLEIDEARQWVIEVVLEDLGEAFRRGLRDLPARELATMLVAGVRRESGRKGIGVTDLYDIPPLPNWCFQRDPQVVFGDGVVFCSMAAAARHREALLSRAIFRFHPRLREVPVVFDPIAAERDHALFVGRARPHIEGGDVLVLSPNLLAVGLSERTNGSGITYLSRALGQREGGPRWMLVVELPRRRAYMHLDTLITQVDHDACLVYPPVILPGGSEEAPVYELDLHAREIRPKRRQNLLRCMARRGVDLEPILCGGEDSVSQQREQWTDGANVMALAPGVITLFDRNLVTAEALADKDFRIVAADDLLLGRSEVELEGEGRVCVLIPSHEISRARGGPHCLVHPLVRDAP